jgi:hypothetical protein
MANYPDDERSFAAQFRLVPTVPKFYNPNTGITWHEIINNNFYDYINTHRILITQDSSGDYVVNTIPKKIEMNNLIAAYYP